MMTVFVSRTRAAIVASFLATAIFQAGVEPAVASPGVMQFGGDVTFGAAATLEIEIAGITPGTGYDQVKVAGELTLGGTLKVLLTGLTPAAGQSFDILDWGSRVGTFSTLNLPALNGLSWNTSQLYTTGVLNIVTFAGVVGDYNNNGAVDAADYVVWRENVGTTNSLPNDPTGGTIGNTQYNTWRANFGQTAAGSGASATAGLPSIALPEPTTILMCFTAAIALAAARPMRKFQGNRA